MTGEDLGYKPGVVENVKFEYYPLFEVLNNKAKSKTDKRNKVVKTDKQDKNFIYNSQHSFAEFKEVIDFKQMSLDSMHKKLLNFRKKFTGFKNFSPQTKNNEDLKAKVLGNVGEFFNELYYIYKGRYEEEKDALNKKDTKIFYCTKLKLTDDYLYESEEENK